jgi:hypothetical protein
MEGAVSARKIPLLEKKLNYSGTRPSFGGVGR